MLQPTLALFFNTVENKLRECIKLHDSMVLILNRLDIYSIVNINVIGTLLPSPTVF